MIRDGVLSIVCDACKRPLQDNRLLKNKRQTPKELGSAATFIYRENAREVAELIGWLTDGDESAICADCKNDPANVERLTEHIVGPGDGLPTCIFCRQIVRDRRKPTLLWTDERGNNWIVPKACSERTIHPATAHPNATDQSSLARPTTKGVPS